MNELPYSTQYLRLTNIVNDNIDLAFMLTSKLNDSVLWHARLGHVYYKRMQDMSKDGLIPAFDMNTRKSLKTSRYTVLERSDTAYWVTWRGLYDSLYGVLDLLDRAYWMEVVLVLNVDQSIIYGVSANVDTAYSLKSGNGLEFA
ncbi:zinc finger, CCHC-type containing protein [Tanacetum coccineum]